MIPSPLPSYLEARELIQNGDIVFIKNGTSIWSKLTQLVTRSRMYHTGIAFWVRDPAFNPHLFLLETHKGGRRIVTLSSYEKHAMEVIEAPLDWSTYCGDFIENTGLIDYSIEEYVAIGLWELFKVRVKTGKLSEVCSKLVALYLNQHPEIEIETNISPGRLYETLRGLGHRTRLSTEPKRLSVPPAPPAAPLSPSSTTQTL